MSILNTILGHIFDVLLYPYRSLNPMFGLTLVSAIASVGMLLGYRATSNQPAIEAVKRKIIAGLFEIRLFNDDLAAILRAQGGILKHNLRYLGLNLVPMVFMIVPFVLVVAQLQFHYGYKGLLPGDTTTLRVTMTDASDAAPDLSLQTPEGISIDSDRVWIPSQREVAWRLRVEQPGTYDLTLQTANETIGKRLVASDQVVRRSPERLAPGFWNQLIYPAEAPLPAASAVHAIHIDYPDRSVGLFGFETHWLVVFFILTIVLAFALKGWFGVTI